MKSNGGKILLFVFLGLVLIGLVFSAGLWTGSILNRNVGDLRSAIQLPLPSTPSDQTASTTVAVDRNTLFVPFWEAWDTLHQQYVDQPLNDSLLLQGAIRGMLSSIGDPHTSYMDPIEFQQANAPLEGEYEGIGAYVDTTGEFLTIISPMPDSPPRKPG